MNWVGQQRLGTLLLEMALALAVLGLLTWGAGQGVRALAEPLARLRTAAALQRVELALARAVASDGALPCPDAREAPDGWPDDAWCPRLGLVPYRALGLAAQDVVDGWGARLSYRPAPNLVALDKGGTAWVPGWGPLACEPTGRLFSRIHPALALLPGPQPPAALLPAYVVISHGPDRRGAVLAGGQVFPADGASPAELANLGNAEARLDAAGDIVRARPPGVVLLNAGCAMGGMGH
ncbi:prepilin-type cleavage/methylation domain-containing protein [Pararhodospirillum photometricum]|uniref:prepilin-type cleavage/methylation domain-containing protein n=1 Tax=Pararhodospirillum photometricum TaxID=1084 RepID=UPI00031A6C0D|nr:prepilin-type cleavage/methylation domain-containing protein [Pararhodospirillum photometricum]